MKTIGQVRPAGGYVSLKQDSLSMSNAAFAELMRAVLDKGAPFRFEASGCSMSPFIRHGDVITISPSSARFRRGDVVAFMNPQGGRLTVHRVVRVSSLNGYLIKGDNSSEFDGRVAGLDIIGRVSRVEHRGRRIRLGLGGERAAIAILSKCGLLTPIIWTVGRLARPFLGRTKRTKGGP